MSNYKHILKQMKKSEILSKEIKNVRKEIKNVRKEIEDIKKNQMEILELRNVITIKTNKQNPPQT